MDIEAEEAVVASCLVDPSVIPEVAHIVAPADFFREKNGWIFGAILDVWARGEDAVNTITVAHKLAESAKLEDVGGQTYLAETIRHLPTSVGAEWYAESVRNTSRARKSIQLLHNISQDIRRAPGEVDATVDAAIEKLLSASADRPRAMTRTLSEVLAGGLFAEIAAFMESPATIRGIETGLEVFDKLVGGLRDGAVYTLMADTSLGKSLLVHNLIRNLAGVGLSSLLFTTEMPVAEVVERMVFQQARIDPLMRRLRGEMFAFDQEKVNDAIGQLTTAAPVYLCDMGGISLPTLQAEARRVIRTKGARVLFVDHLQHISVPGVSNPVERIAQVTKGTKSIALDESVPVVQVSHINRDSQASGITHRSGKGGSSIEQDSDVIIALEPMVWIAGEQVVATKEQADRHLADEGWVLVRATVQKGRSGGAGVSYLRLDWRREGGRFLPWEGAA